MSCTEREGAGRASDLLLVYTDTRYSILEKTAANIDGRGLAVFTGQFPGTAVISHT